MAFFDFIDSLLKGASGTEAPVGDTESVRKIARLLEGVDPERARFWERSRI